jgi:hypothetical protein
LISNDLFCYRYFTYTLVGLIGAGYLLYKGKRWLTGILVIMCVVLLRCIFYKFSITAIIALIIAAMLSVFRYQLHLRTRDNKAMIHKIIIKPLAERLER